MIPTAQQAADKAAAIRKSTLAGEREKVASIIKQAVDRGKTSCMIQSLSAEMKQELIKLGYEVDTGYSNPRDPYNTYTIRWFD